MLKQIFYSERIFASIFLILLNICFKIFVLKQRFANLQVNFTLKQIFASKYLHTVKYSLGISLNYVGKPFTTLRPQLILHRKKRLASFPSPHGMSLPNSPLAGIMTSYIYYSRLEGVWIVTFRLRTGNSQTFFTV